MFEPLDHVAGSHDDEDQFAETNEPRAEVDRESVVPGLPIPLD